MTEELTERYINFFLNSQSSIVELELIELSHPNFSTTYCIVRNAVEGVTVKLETGQFVFFDYYPLSLEGSTVREDLDYIIKIKVGDLGEIIPNELDNVSSAEGGFQIKPTLMYRSYRSDELRVPMFGPLRLEVTEFNFVKDGAEFEAKAPLLNINRTGEVYTLDRFPMLRGFI